MKHLFEVEKLPHFFCAFLVVEKGCWQLETTQKWTYQVEALFH